MTSIRWNSHRSGRLWHHFLQRHNARRRPCSFSHYHQQCQQTQQHRPFQHRLFPISNHECPFYSQFRKELRSYISCTSSTWAPNKAMKDSATLTSTSRPPKQQQPSSSSSSSSSSSATFVDYQSIAINKIVLNDDYTSIDTTEVEMNIQRLVNECQENPNPNLLLNLLEMLQNEDVPLSQPILHQTFRLIVQSQHIKLLEKAESLIIWNHQYDANLLRLILIGYINAGASDKAGQLLLKWTQRKNNADRPQQQQSYRIPDLQSYRTVLSALSREGNYKLAFELLQQLCDGQQTKTLPPPDRDCFHRVLIACKNSQEMNHDDGNGDDDDDDAFKVVQQVLGLMMKPPPTLPPITPMKSSWNIMSSISDNNPTLPTKPPPIHPTTSTIRLFLQTWIKSKSKQDVSLMQQEAFDMLREMENNAKQKYHDNVNHDNPVQPKEEQLATDTTLTAIPDIQCYNIVFDVMAQTSNYELAEERFFQLLQDYLNGLSDIQPDEITFHTVLKSHLHANTIQATESAEQFVQKVGDIARQQRTMMDTKKGHGTESDNDCQEENEENTMSNDAGSNNTKSDDDKKPPRYTNIQPTSRAYGTIIAMWTKLGRPDRAIDVLVRAEDTYQYYSKLHPKKIQQFLPDSVCYANIITCLSKIEPMSVEIATQAQDILLKMIRMEHKPNVITCNIVLKCWSDAGQPQEANTFMEKMMKQQLGLTPDIISYNTIIQGYTSRGQTKKAMELVDQLIENAKKLEDQQSHLKSSSALLPQPNVRTFTGIIVALSKQKTMDAAQQAENILFQMQDLYDKYNLQTRPNRYTYNSVMNCWSSIWLDNEYVKKRENPGGHRAEKILRGMQSVNERPDVASYNCVMKGYRYDLEKAESLLEEMKLNRLHPDERTYKTLWHIVKNTHRSRQWKEEKFAQLKQQYFLPMSSNDKNNNGQHQSSNVRQQQSSDNKGQHKRNGLNGSKRRRNEEPRT